MHSTSVMVTLVTPLQAHHVVDAGYDEDLRRMMIEAGFFQTAHAREI